jgi:nucleoid DNA-binding protein
MARVLAKKKSSTRGAKKTSHSSKKIGTVTKSFTKTEILEALANNTEVPKKKVSDLICCLYEVIGAHLKKGLSFALPGLLKINVVNKPATKARKGINPFTKEPITIKAKPARKVVKVRPLKKLKTFV